MFPTGDIRRDLLAARETARLGASTVFEGAMSAIFEIGSSLPVVAPICLCLLKVKSIVAAASRNKDELVELRERCALITAQIVDEVKASQTFTIDVSSFQECIDKLEVLAERYHDQECFAWLARFRTDGDDIQRLRSRIEAVAVMELAVGVNNAGKLDQILARLQPGPKLAPIPETAPVVDNRFHHVLVEPFGQSEHQKGYAVCDVQDKLVLNLVFLARLVVRQVMRQAMRQAIRVPEHCEDLMKKDAQLPALDENMPADQAIMTWHSDGTEDEGVTLDSIRMEDSARPVSPLMRIGSVNVQLGEEANLSDYSLPKSAPTLETVEEVMQLFEAGGEILHSKGIRHADIMSLENCLVDAERGVLVDWGMRIKTEKRDPAAQQFFNHFNDPVVIDLRMTSHHWGARIEQDYPVSDYLNRDSFPLENYDDPYRLGNPEEADVLYWLVVEIEALDPDHPTFSIALNNWLEAQGVFAAAGPLHERGQAIEKVLGREHLWLARTLCIQAMLLKAPGSKHDEAEPSVAADETLSEFDPWAIWAIGLFLWEMCNVVDFVQASAQYLAHQLALRLELRYIARLQKSRPAYGKGISATRFSPMLGMIAASVSVPGVAAMGEPFGERLGSTVSEIVVWLGLAPRSVQLLAIVLAGVSVYNSIMVSIRDIKAGNAELAAAKRESRAAQQAAIARGNSNAQHYL